MLIINERFVLLDEELSFSYARSGGPGGQNVNKVSSKAILRWHLSANSTLPPEVLLRLRGLQRNRLTKEGDLLIVSQTYRDQERNRRDCLDRLRAIILQALMVPKPRKPTRPTSGSQQRRLEAKRHRSEIKRHRMKFED